MRERTEDERGRAQSELMVRKMFRDVYWKSDQIVWSGNALAGVMWFSII